MPRRELLRNVRRIVVKIGTSLITEKGLISRKKIMRLVSDIADLRKRGYEIVVVSSGAISAGCGVLQKDRRFMSIPEKQAAAAIGQILLMNEYRACFKKKGYEIGQILLTEDDVKNRRRFLNSRHTMNTLIEMGVIPVVNENDSVAVKEIKFGDNDTLSAHVANIVQADLLILLSDVDGFYMDLADPHPVDEIHKIDEEILSRAGDSESIHGTGGMLTKLRAADIIIKSGEKMIIANGNVAGVLGRIMNGEKIGTIFVGKESPLKGKKRWIAFSANARGSLIIDEGAVRALVERKKSLLATGIISSDGKYDLGDAVEIKAPDGTAIGKGIVNYSSEEIEKIKGKKTNEIRLLLGQSFFEEVINRDNLILY
ncbi:MAG: glutamate 5-kinase [Spirochaetes bacterium]|nr:glutamate 5-kinase [Spirochaetota bacterium]